MHFPSFDSVYKSKNKEVGHNRFIVQQKKISHDIISVFKSSQANIRDHDFNMSHKITLHYPGYIC